MSRCQLLHGIHVGRGKPSVGRLRSHIASGSGLSVVYREYGDLFAVQTGSHNPGIAESLLPQVGRGDVLVGHSNGCAIWMRALQMGAPAVGLVLLNAALKDDIEFPPQLKFVHVYFNQYDEAVPLTNFPVLRRWLFDPLWGDMGRDGYRGKDPRVTQFDCWNRDDELPDLAGHSSILAADNADDWGFFIGRQIAGALMEAP